MFHKWQAWGMDTGMGQVTVDAVYLYNVNIVIPGSTWNSTSTRYNNESPRQSVLRLVYLP